MKASVLNGRQPPWLPDGSGRVFIIAEIGVNHDGSARRALDLVRLAADCGVDAVKFQYFEADILMGRDSRLARYQRRSGERSPHDMLKRLQLPLSHLGRAADCAHRLGLKAIVTVFSDTLVRRAESITWDAYKSASPDIVHMPLLLAMAGTGRPLILSTGASHLEEVSRAITWLSESPGQHDRLAVLQCVSAYPTELKNAALGGMDAIRRIFLGPVGYSDHTPEVQTGALAAAAGAVILEKHLTDDRSGRGPDHAASLDGPMMRRYVESARAAAAARGAVHKSVQAIEMDVRAVSRQSVTARRPLRAGVEIKIADLCFKRPGTGIPPFRATELVDRRLVRSIGRDEPILERHLSTPGAIRPSTSEVERSRKRIMIITGTRAEFGLLKPVMKAVRERSTLDLFTVVTGVHLLPEVATWREVALEFDVRAKVAMQRSGRTGRGADAQAVGRGITGLASLMERQRPDWVVVLGDRIEAFAGASAAAIAGVPLCHIHGGDRAEGIADESLRHAISKMAHLHAAASELSAARLRAMGERPDMVFVTGSPAVDDLRGLDALSKGECIRMLGVDPDWVVLQHPAGLGERGETAVSTSLAETAARLSADGMTVLWLEPNRDEGREPLVSAMRSAVARGHAASTQHMPREVFLRLLKRLARKKRGGLIGNSSAGLIECAPIGTPVINIGPRQSGREQCGRVLDVPGVAPTAKQILNAMQDVLDLPKSAVHPYGDGAAGTKIAALLESFVPPRGLRKQNVY